MKTKHVSTNRELYAAVDTIVAGMGEERFSVSLGPHPSGRWEEIRIGWGDPEPYGAVSFPCDAIRHMDDASKVLFVGEQTEVLRVLAANAEEGYATPGFSG